MRTPQFPIRPNQPQPTTPNPAAQPNPGPKMMAEQAAKALEKTDDVGRLLDQAKAKSRAGDYQDAEADARRAIAIDPNNVEAWAQLAYALNMQRRFDEALAAADKAIALDPKNASAHFNRAMALEGLGRFQEALKEYELAASLDPNYAAALKEARERILPQTAFGSALARDPRADFDFGLSTAAEIKQMIFWALAIGLPLAAVGAWVKRKSRRIV